MQKVKTWLLGHKNQLMVGQVILLIVGIIGKFVWQSRSTYFWTFALAGILGTLPILVQALEALKVKVVSIDVLVSIAAIGAMVIGNVEEAAVVTFLFLFGSWLEGKTLAYTRSSIKALSQMAPETALVKEEDGSFQERDVDLLDEGDVVLVKTGAKLAVDGTVVKGEGYLNEAAISGESSPVHKSQGDQARAGTILENGSLQVQADKVGEDTTFGRIISLVEEAQDAKSSTERFIDKFAKYYTPGVLLLGILVGLFSQDIELAITILVLGCPGALVIGVPVSNVAGIGNGAKHGVLLKGSESIQAFAGVDTMVFDKTGTLTLGQAQVSDAQYYGEGTDLDQALSYLASLEQESDHPLAKAILAYLGDPSPSSLTEAVDTQVIKGGGITGQVGGHTVACGNLYLMEKLAIPVSKSVRQASLAYQEKGNSIVLTAVDGQVKSLMGIRDQIRPGLKGHLGKLRQLGINTMILASGDNQKTVDQVSQSLGLDQAMGDMLPEDKATLVKDLQESGHQLAFIGDGINDSPSLAQADIGIAMGSGTDTAMDTSDLVLVQSDFDHLTHALGLSQATSRNMKQNIVIAISVVVVLVAMLLWSPWMNMSIGMLVHEGSILVVILNALRLLAYKNKSFERVLPSFRRKDQINDKTWLLSI